MIEIGDKPTNFPTYFWSFKWERPLYYPGAISERCLLHINRGTAKLNFYLKTTRSTLATDRPARSHSIIFVFKSGWYNFCWKLSNFIQYNFFRKPASRWPWEGDHRPSCQSSQWWQVKNSDLLQDRSGSTSRTPTGDLHRTTPSTSSPAPPRRETTRTNSSPEIFLIEIL